MASTCVKAMSRDSRLSASIPARWGSTIVAAFVPDDSACFLVQGVDDLA